MDEYGVPAIDRPRWFKFNVFGGWSVEGLLLMLLLRCLNANNKAAQQHAADIVNARLDERTRARAEFLQDEERKMKEIQRKDAEIKEYFQKLDSLKRRS